MDNPYQNVALPPGGEYEQRRSAPSGAEQSQGVRLLQIAAQLMAQNGGRVPQLIREGAQEQWLERQGAAGQEAAPKGMGPQPLLQHAPGGGLLEGVQHPAFTTVEHFFRVLPEDRWSNPSVSPTNPIKFELGAFKVPSSQIFLLTDYQFTVLRQSGVDPFDFINAAPGRFSGYMGFDVTVSGRRMSDLFYQLDPAPVQFQRQSFQAPIPTNPEVATQRQFNNAQANSFGSVAGVGTSLLPVRPNVQGPRDQPFTMVAGQNDAVALSTVIFRRVMAPLAGIEGSLRGYQIHQNTMSALLNRIRPR